MTNSRAIIVGSAAVVICGLLVVIGMKASRSSKSSAPPEHLVFAVAALLDSVPALVADRQGYFKGEGLDVEVKMYSTGKDALAAVRRGEADFATVADFPFVLAVLDGADIQVLATICKSGRENSIVARRDRGITEQEHIRGKVVGVIPGTSSEFLLDEFLIMKGIPHTDLTVVELKPEETVNALLAGKVDAVSTWSQYTAQLLKSLGNNGVRFFSEETYQMYWNIVATRKFVNGNKDSVRKFVKALDRANNYIMHDEDGAQKVALSSLKLESAQLKDVWDDYEFDLSLDHTLPITLESQARWVCKRKGVAVSDVPNFHGFVYMDALLGIKPAAVTVMR